MYLYLPKYAERARYLSPLSMVANFNIYFYCLLGSQGKEHIEAAQKHTKIKIVAGVESSKEARQALAQAYPNIMLFNDILALKQASTTLGLQGLILAFI